VLEIVLSFKIGLEAPTVCTTLIQCAISYSVPYEGMAVQGILNIE
jgi:hypothetical protein